MSKQKGVTHVPISEQGVASDLVKKIAKKRGLLPSQIQRMFTYNAMSVNQVSVVMGLSISQVYTRLNKGRLTTMSLFPSYEDSDRTKYRIFVLRDEKFESELEQSLINK